MSIHWDTPEEIQQLRQEVENRDRHIRQLREENKILNALLKELNEVCGWKDESALHAILHIKNFVSNLKTDVKVEKTLRMMLIKKLKKIIIEESK
jgi:predicted RNase H-like nuclease (RuvC/YqgF family)